MNWIEKNSDYLICLETGQEIQVRRMYNRIDIHVTGAGVIKTFLDKTQYVEFVDYWTALKIRLLESND